MITAGVVATEVSSTPGEIRADTIVISRSTGKAHRYLTSVPDSLEYYLGSADEAGSCKSF